MIALALPVFAADAEIEVTAPAEPGPAVVDVDAVARPADGVEDVLATVPGVRIRRLGGLGAFAGISLRGTGLRQTLVRLDGVPLNPDGVAAVDLSRLPLAGLETIRVTTGRPPATAGAAPIGGVVDLQTAARPSLARAEIAGGSFRSARASAAVARSSDAVQGLLAVDALATGGSFAYLDDGGTRFVATDDRFVPRADNDRWQLSGLGRLRVDRWTVLATAAARSEGLPGPIGIPMRDVRLDTGRGLLAVAHRATRAAADRQVFVYAIVRRERLRDPLGELGRVDGVQRDRFDVVGAQLAGQRAGGRVAVRGSLGARVETFGRRDGPRATRVAGASAVDAPTRLGAVTVTPGLDVRGLVSGDRALGAVLPGVTAVLFADRAVGAWLSATEGFRPPDLTELYGDRGTLIGDPELRPERASKAELGVRARREGRWSGGLDAAVSATWTRDAIGWLQNTQRTLVAVNFGRTRTLGVEAGARLALDERVGIDASVTVLDAVQTTDDPTRRGRPVPFVAPLRSWSRAFVRPVRPLALTVDVDHTSAVPVDPQGVTTQPRRTLLSVGVAVEPHPRWTLALRVDNALDTRTGLVPRDPLSADDTRIAAPITDFVGYPLPGRTAWASVRYSASTGRTRP